MRATVRLAARHGDERRHRRRDWVARLAALVAGIAVLTGAAAVTRAGLPTPRPAITVGAGAASLASLQASAADQVAAALAKGGTGISFEIVQRSTIKARPDGAKIPVPDPVDPHRTLGLADEYFLNALLERGFATADGFYSEMLAGPAPGKAPDWNGEIRLQALQRDGTVYRNEGEGWYEHDDTARHRARPGVGAAVAGARAQRHRTRRRRRRQDGPFASQRHRHGHGRRHPGRRRIRRGAVHQAHRSDHLLPRSRRAAGRAPRRRTQHEPRGSTSWSRPISPSRYAVDGPLPDAAPALADEKAAVQP